MIVQNYNAKNFRKEKVKNKTRTSGRSWDCQQDDKKFMIGIVSRLTDQKGLDLIQCVMDEICTEDVQLVVLGTGDERYENMFRHYDWKYQRQGFREYLLFRGHVAQDLCGLRCVPDAVPLRALRLEPAHGAALRHGADRPGDRRLEGHRRALQRVRGNRNRILLRQLQRPRDAGHASATRSTSTTTRSGSGTRSSTGPWRRISPGGPRRSSTRSFMTG